MNLTRREKKKKKSKMVRKKLTVKKTEMRVRLERKKECEVGSAVDQDRP